MSFELQNHQGKAVVVSFSGRMAGAQVAMIRQGLDAGLKSSHRLVLDCRELEYMDSSGLGALISGLKTALSRGGDLRLAAVSPKVRMMLEITRADRLFSLYQTPSEAVASYDTNPVEPEDH